MAKYFDSDELTRSETATRRGIDNTPTPETAARLEVLAEKLLDPVRELWGAPLTVNSGYRCPELNRAVGGAATSQHLLGEAADITTGSPGGNRRLFEMIVAATTTPPFGHPSTGGEPGLPQIEFDQLIDESDYSWLHLSYREGKNRLQILHL